jgi:hypothetical protein
MLLMCSQRPSQLEVDDTGARWWRCMCQDIEVREECTERGALGSKTRRKVHQLGRKWMAQRSEATSCTQEIVAETRERKER